MIDWVALKHNLIPLVVAAFLGGAVGLERELRGRWAGLRTHILVAVGSAVFVLAGAVAANRGEAISEVTRVIQGVATGVGFIGAGTILKLSDRNEVHGLTTASSVWMAAAVGVACALRLYPLAVSSAVLALIVLTVLRRLEKAIEPGGPSS